MARAGRAIGMGQLIFTAGNVMRPQKDAQGIPPFFLPGRLRRFTNLVADTAYGDDDGGVHDAPPGEMNCSGSIGRMVGSLDLDQN